MQKLRIPLIMLAVLGLVIGLGCSEDDDSSPTGTGDDPTSPWVGVWLSEGENVADILVVVFNYDSVRVTMTDEGTVTLETHVLDGAWSTLNGTYAVTEEATGDIHSIAINYTAFEQEGIIQVTEGTPDEMLLEVVQTVPDIGATPLTPADGFGADPVLQDTNIQTYVRVE